MGSSFYPKEYVKDIERFCKKNNILLCFDEMQSGFAEQVKNLVSNIIMLNQI